jgi:hypothetical protein
MPQNRFMAIYHCHDAAEGGPVRSARFDDPKIAKPFTRILAYSGANAIVEAELRAQDMVALDEDSGAAFYRVPAGVFTVHNLFTDTEAVRRLASGHRVAPPTDEVFEFGEVPEDDHTCGRCDGSGAGSMSPPVTHSAIAST